MSEEENELIQHAIENMIEVLKDHSKTHPHEKDWCKKAILKYKKLLKKMSK